MVWFAPRESERTHRTTALLRTIRSIVGLQVGVRRRCVLDARRGRLWREAAVEITLAGAGRQPGAARASRPHCLNHKTVTTLRQRPRALAGEAVPIDHPCR